MLPIDPVSLTPPAKVLPTIYTVYRSKQEWAVTSSHSVLLFLDKLFLTPINIQTIIVLHFEAKSFDSSPQLRNNSTIFKQALPLGHWQFVFIYQCL